MDLLAYHRGLVTGFQAVMPVRKFKVQTHPGRFDLGELKQYAVDAPCMLVALLDWPLSGNGQASGEMQVAAYLLTKSAREGKHSEINLALSSIAVERLACVGLNHVRCTQIRWANLYTGALDQEGVSLSAISFRQQLTVDPPNPDTALASFRELAITWDEGADAQSEAADQLRLEGA